MKTRTRKGLLGLPITEREQPRPYGRSYMELEPRRTTPKWFGEDAQGNPLPDNGRRERITTDDAVFELCITTQSHKNKGQLLAAYLGKGSWQQGHPGRGVWRQIVIDKRRIISREVINT